MLSQGCCSLTDGVYCWPEGYAHYVAYHGIAPPPEFISHARAHLERQREVHGQGKKRLVWDAEKREARAAPPETERWLKTQAAVLMSVENVAPRACCHWF